MALIGFSILFPVFVALVLFFVKNDSARAVIVYASAAIIAAAAICLAVLFAQSGPVTYACQSEIVNYACMAVSDVMTIIVLVYAIKHKKILVFVLALIQLPGATLFEILYSGSTPVANGLYVDALSVIMTLIIGIIGSGICVYAVGYMRDFQAHEPEGAKDRRPLFFALMFLFLGAMNLIVFSNNMSWLFTGWEVTTVCSFLLIGYTKTEEAIRNSFRQIYMNMIGGLAFLGALYYSAVQLGTLDFQMFLAFGVANPMLVVLPVTALALAGLTKAAQMPFHTWLLGAMVAPTPTSALLHSSTMVKAGVFLLIKLSPVLLVCTIPSIMVILIGGATFCLCSFMAISQTNAKRVLAYSTIANLGLIAACAGVGTPEAMWAAIFLVIFHAAAKSLLFICVGTAEHHIGSRNIEDMDLLFERMPRLARFMMLGIMCMFIAPFGMLVSKWAALMSFVETQQLVLIVLLAFGSAATFMFWAKWLGKLAGIAGKPDNIETTVHKSEWVSIGLMSGLVIATCVALPVISDYVVTPYCITAYGLYAEFAALITASAAMLFGDLTLWIVSACALVMVIVIFFGIGRDKGKRVGVYLAGVSVDDASRSYRNSLSASSEATTRNWYLEGLFGEARINPFSTVFTATIICIALIVSILICGGLI